jgi:hypothetical protein
MTPVLASGVQSYTGQCGVSFDARWLEWARRARPLRNSYERSRASPPQRKACFVWSEAEDPCERHRPDNRRHRAHSNVGHEHIGQSSGNVDRCPDQLVDPSWALQRLLICTAAK